MLRIKCKLSVSCIIGPFRTCCMKYFTKSFYTSTKKTIFKGKKMLLGSKLFPLNVRPSGKTGKNEEGKVAPTPPNVYRNSFDCIQYISIMH